MDCLSLPQILEESVCVGFPACLVLGLSWKKPTEMNASIINNCCIQVQTGMVITKQDGIEKVVVQTYTVHQGSQNMQQLAQSQSIQLKHFSTHRLNPTDRESSVPWATVYNSILQIKWVWLELVITPLASELQYMMPLTYCVYFFCRA